MIIGNYWFLLKKARIVSRDTLISRFIQIQYERNDYEFIRGRLRVRGDVVEIFPSYEEKALRIEFFGDKNRKNFRDKSCIRRNFKFIG